MIEIGVLCYLDHLCGPSCKRDLDGDEWIVTHCGHGFQGARDSAPVFGIDEGSEASGDLHLDVCHPEATPGIVREADIPVVHEAELVLFVACQSFVEVVASDLAIRRR